MSDEIPWYAPGHHREGIPRERIPGEEVWRLDGNGKVHTCELFDQSRAGAGWDVMVLSDGEPIMSRRCETEVLARFVANCVAGSREVERTEGG